MSTDKGKQLGRPVDKTKRLAIVEAATRSFFDVGFAATSIEAVAQDAGVSKVTVYNHFTDKRGLFTAAVEHECERMRGMLELDRIGEGSLRERLTTLGQTMSAFLAREEMTRFEVRIAAETEHEPDIGLAFLEAGPYRMKTAFAMLLQGMVAQGELAIPDAELAAEQFVGMCKGLGDLERRFGCAIDQARDEERIAGAVDVFLRAYASNEHG